MARIRVPTLPTDDDGVPDAAPGPPSGPAPAYEGRPYRTPLDAAFDGTTVADTDEFGIQTAAGLVERVTTAELVSALAGATAGKFAAGDDARIVGAMQSAGPANLTDRTSASNVALRSVMGHYYVDYAHGNDAWDGLSQGTPKKTLASVLGSNRVIHLANGNVQAAGAVVIDSLTHLTIMGAANFGTQYVVNGDYDAFTLTGPCSDVVIKDLLITSFVARSAGAGVNVTSASTAAYSIKLERVQIQNTYSGLVLNNVSTSRFTDVAVVQTTAGRMAGNGISMIKTVSCRFKDCSVTATAGKIGGYGVLVDSDCDTIRLPGLEVGNCTLDNIALRNTLGAGHTGPRLFRINDGWCEGSLANGLAVYSGRDVRVSGLELAGNALDGILVAGGSSIKLVEPFVTQSGHHGINIAASGGDDALDTVIIKAPDLTNNSQTTTNTYDGLSINANTPVSVVGGRSGDHTYSLTNKQRYGVDIAASTDYVQISGMNLGGNQSGQLRNASTGLNNSVQGQRGWQIPHTWGSADLAAYTAIAANEAMYYRVRGSARAQTKVGVWIGVQSGNISIAVVRGKPGTNAPTTRLATTGAVACPAPGYSEIALDVPVDVDEETCWLAISADNATVTFGRGPAPGGADTAGGNGFCYRASSHHPIPASPTSLNGSIKIGIILCTRA